MDTTAQSPAMQPMTARELMAKLQASRGGNTNGRPTPQRKRSFVPDAGFTTFTAGIRVGWQNEILSRKFRQAVAAEFMAMALFVAFGTASVIYTDNMPMLREVVISAAFGIMIMVMVYAVGDISGANLNPAVTLSLYVTKKVSTLRAVLYIIAQCLGAMVGSGYIKSLAIDRFTRAGGAANSVTDSPDVNLWTALGGEILGTMLLVFTVSAAADVGRETHRKYVGALTPMCIGASVFLAHVFLIPIDGCSINPARSFGSAVVQNQWKDHWVFWVGPLVGGPLAALAYDFLFKMPPTTAEVIDDVVNSIERTSSGRGRSGDFSADGLPPSFSLPGSAELTNSPARTAVSTSGMVTVKMPKLPPASPPPVAQPPQILVPGLAAATGMPTSAGGAAPSTVRNAMNQPGSSVSAPLLARASSTRGSAMPSDANASTSTADGTVLEMASRQSAVSDWR